MEITPSMIYWISRMDYLQGLCIASLVVGILVSALLLAMLFAHCTDSIELPRWHAKAFAISSSVVAFSALALTFTPGTRECMAMYVIPRIAASRTVRELGPLAVEKAKQWLESIAPEGMGGNDDGK